MDIVEANFQIVNVLLVLNVTLICCLLKNAYARQN